jgi:hypothetical protein
MKRRNQWFWMIVFGAMTLGLYQSIIAFPEERSVQTENTRGQLPESDLSEVEFEFLESDVPQIRTAFHRECKKFVLQTLVRIPQVFSEISYPPPQA